MSKLTLTQILNQEKPVASEQLTAITAIINTARKAYGNADAEVATPKVNTTEGMVDLKYASAKDKVALVRREVSTIRAKAIETVEATEGAQLDKEIERLLSINPILVNLAAESESAYI